MPIIVSCSSCQRSLRVPDDLLGKLVKCPTCGHTFTATASDAASPGAAAPGSGAEFVSEREPVRPSRGEPGYEERYESYEDAGHMERPVRRRRADLQPHRGTLILVLGILSLVVLHVILGPIAWIMGNNDLREMRAGRMDPEGESNTNAGRICGIIGTSLGLVGIVCCFLWFIFVFALGAGGAAAGRR